MVTQVCAGKTGDEGREAEAEETLCVVLQDNGQSAWQLNLDVERMGREIAEVGARAEALCEEEEK